VTTRRFLVLHGGQNRRPAHHWQWQLVESLRATGEQVLYLQFPEPDRPVLATWTELLGAELAQLGTGGRVVVAHCFAVPVYRAPGIDTDPLPGAAHLDPDAGYGRWPAAEAWCRDPQSRLTPR
jgi:hypothetical protein